MNKERAATAVEFGSVAVAELVARAQADQAEGWQQRMVQIEQQQLAALREIDRNTRNPAPVPPVIVLPPW